MADKEEMIERIKELSVLVNDIEESPAWKVAMKELKAKIETLDSCWQSCPQDKLLELQITKLSVMEIIRITEEWKEELEALKEELNEEEQ